MKINFDQQLIKLANNLPSTLYAVGGYVRNFLLGDNTSRDIDLAGAITIENLIEGLSTLGITPSAIYKRTGTVMFFIGEYKCEFTSFRKESYSSGGAHTPISTQFTEDIVEDALRRDFKCNAVYYDIKRQKIVDVLSGIEDIKNKKLDTVQSPKEVFSHDGLRLLRLARFAGELGFVPTKKVIEEARKHSDNILDVSAERIREELDRILVADTKYSFSKRGAQYRALKILEECEILKKILPEIALGLDMKQREDYHSHSVLEHTLRAVMYADSTIRLSALLHDVGKPKCMIDNGKYYGHEKVGEKLANQILTRLKYDNKTKKEVEFLVKNHMYDIDGKTRESKVRQFIVANWEYIDKLLLLKQADYSACKDDLSTNIVVEKWKKIICKMQSDGTPFSVKELKIQAKDLIEVGIAKESISKVLKKLLDMAVKNPSINQKEKLLAVAKINL